MANTLQKCMTVGSGHIYIFETTSAATTETMQLPPGKSLALLLSTQYIAGTPTVPTNTYVRATGVFSVIGLTATNNIMFAILTD